MENDEKDENRAETNDARLNIAQFDGQYKEYLNNKNNQDNTNGKILFNQMEKDFEKIKQSINKIIKNNEMIESNKIDVYDSMNVHNICKFIQTQINKNFIVKKIQFSNNNNVDWRFNYFYDFKNRGQSKGIHGIYDNGKTFHCKYNGRGCSCFCRVSFGMKPNSGTYKIKFKINNIYNKCTVNAIGITCNTHKTNNSKSRYDDYWYCSHDYIAWSSWDNNGKSSKNVPSGLICGYSDDYQSHNIFVLSNFKYMSNNNSYLQVLPFIKTGDVIEMFYDSNNNELSFSKSNDALLNSKIVNLPKDKTFYWIVGHEYQQMSVMIVE